MRTPVVNCEKCDTEFDGATDAERFHVLFCPMHKLAPQMLEALKMAVQCINKRSFPMMIQDFEGLIRRAEAND